MDNQAPNDKIKSRSADIDEIPIPALNSTYLVDSFIFLRCGWHTMFGQGRWLVCALVRFHQWETRAVLMCVSTLQGPRKRSLHSLLFSPSCSPCAWTSDIAVLLLLLLIEILFHRRSSQEPREMGVKTPHKNPQLWGGLSNGGLQPCRHTQHCAFRML